MPVVAQPRTVTLRAQLRAAHVFHAHQRSVRAGFQNDVVEFRRFAQPPDRPHADLIRLPARRRRLADLPGRYLHVLFLQRRQNVRGRQSALRHFRGIEPQSHGVLALAENDGVRNAGHALEGIANIHVHVIAEEQTVVLPAFRVHAGAKHKSAGLLADKNSRVLHFVRQAPQRLVDPVLHIHRS